MEKFDIESRERLVRVEVGVLHLTTLLTNYMKETCQEHGCVLQNDVESLKTTQRYVRWFSKTAVGAGVITLFGLLIKGAIYFGSKS